jgi:N-carbamoylputrescine amidase
MRIAIVECSFSPEDLSGQVDRLVAETRELGADLTLLPEMPVGPWLAGQSELSADRAAESVLRHDLLISLLADSGEAFCLTRPVWSGDRLMNQAGFVHAAPFAPFHSKQIFPSEDGWHETAWFAPGTPRFDVLSFGGLHFGFAICTEMMWPAMARNYLRLGVDVLLCPRATGGSLETWTLAARMLSLVSGCYVLSSNHSDGAQFNGSAFSVSPGAKLGRVTSRASRVAAIDIDPEEVIRGRQDYPAYIPEPSLPF